MPEPVANVPPPDYAMVIAESGGDFDVNMFAQPALPALSPVLAVGMVEEMRFWLQIMSDHARLIRSGLDVTDEELFRYVDCLGLSIDELLALVQAASPPFSLGQVECLMAEANRRVTPLRELKRNLAAMVRECRIHIQLPADMLEHIRREADFFLGILNRPMGWPVPTRSDLEIPAPPAEENCPACLAPRSVIPCLGQGGAAVLLDEILFFADINAEHGIVLSLFFRPIVQDELSANTREAGERALGLFREMSQARRAGATLADMRGLIARDREAVSAWVDYLRCLKESIGCCRVPTGQVNFAYHLLHHMEHEACYTLELMDMAQGV